MLLSIFYAIPMILKLPKKLLLEIHTKQGKKSARDRVRTSCSIHIRMKNGLETESKKDGGLNGVFIPTLADEGCANIGLVIKIFVEILNGERKLYER